MHLLEPGGDFDFVFVRHLAPGNVGKSTVRGARPSHLEADAHLAQNFESVVDELGPCVLVGIAICEEVIAFYCLLGLTTLAGALCLSQLDCLLSTSSASWGPVLCRCCGPSACVAGTEESDC